VETFVIRIWTPADGHEPERLLLHGFAEHIDSSERTAFRGVGELLAFLEATLERRRHSQPERSTR
jgi:hypothetical protein